MLRYVLATMDTVVWPNNTQYVSQCVQTVHAIANMFAKHAAHLQLPVLQAQTQMKAVIEHRRYLEDQPMAAGFDVLQQLNLIFDKSTLPAGDKRPPWHPCLFITSNLEGVGMWDSCSAVATYKVDRTMSVNSRAMMLGYDGDNRPAPAARLEQSFGMCV